MNCIVLSITFRDQIAEETQRLLEQNQFAVITASDFKQLEELCARGGFSVALVEGQIQPKVKRAIGRLLRTSCPWAPVVEMCTGDPEIPGAEPVPSEQLNEIAPAIKKILAQKKLKNAS